MSDRITFTTDDDVKIVGDWTSSPNNVGAAVLVHMMPLNRSSWTLFARALAKRGVASLAIDMRGHGDSVEGPEGQVLDYKTFGDAEHQSCIWDVIGAVSWVRTRGISIDRIGLAGASIGANLAVRMLTEEPRMPGAVLLSPGENYRGLHAPEDAQKLLSGQALFIAASQDDPESYATSQALFDAAPISQKQFFPYANAGHGTAIFSAEPKLMEKAADWLAGVIRGT